MYHTYSFEKLEVYKNALQLSISIRTITDSFPKQERYELTSQLKRATDSIGANIAEGSGRSSNLDQAHFSNMAFSSGLEVINHLNLASKLGYIEAEIYENVRKDIDLILNQLNSLYKFQIKNRTTLKKRLKD